MGFNSFGNIDLLSTILETMTDGVMVVDPEGTILCLNPSAERITGYSSPELVGKPCIVLDTDTCTVGSGDEKHKKCELFKEGSVTSKRCQIRNKNGKNIMLLKNAVVLKDEKGKVIGAVETMTDITSLFMKEMEIEELRQEITHEHGYMGLIGKSPAMRKVYEQIENASQTDVPVIVMGESGTGKELVAEAIHRLSKRKRGPFVRVNCAALNEHLLESELFGHRKGSFTGAIKDRQGRFEAAHRGSLFLDEIGDMPISMQIKLLRVLQEKEVERIGDNYPLKVDVRIITATNQKLSELVEEGMFREDLFYRVNVFPISIPPLRERIEDLPILASHYLKRINVIHQKQITRLTPRALEALEAYDWPGNVRQLINALEYSAITCNGDSVDLTHLPEYVQSKTKKNLRDLKRNNDEVKRILDALRKNNFHRTRTAEYLGISRVALWKKMKRLDIAV